MFSKVNATLASALALLAVDPGPSPRLRYSPDNSTPGGAFGTPGTRHLSSAQRMAFLAARRDTPSVYAHEFLGR